MGTKAQSAAAKRVWATKTPEARRRAARRLAKKLHAGKTPAERSAHARKMVTIRWQKFYARKRAEARAAKAAAR